jgi:hypothetical protein
MGRRARDATTRPFALLPRNHHDLSHLTIRRSPRRPPAAASVAVGGYPRSAATGTPYRNSTRLSLLPKVSHGAFHHNFSSGRNGRMTDLPEVRQRDAACLDCS